MTLPVICLHCRYFTPPPARSSSLQRRGHCHRHPPAAVSSDDRRWPAVLPTDFCGEYAPDEPSDEGDEPDSPAELEADPAVVVWALPARARFLLTLAVRFARANVVVVNDVFADDEDPGILRAGPDLNGTPCAEAEFTKLLEVLDLPDGDAT